MFGKAEASEKQKLREALDVFRAKMHLIDEDVDIVENDGFEIILEAGDGTQFYLLKDDLISAIGPKGWMEDLVGLAKDRLAFWRKRKAQRCGSSAAIRREWTKSA